MMVWEIMKVWRVFIVTSCFLLGLFIYLFIYYICLIVCLCVWFGFSGFLDEKCILVILGLRASWSFDEWGYFSNLRTKGYFNNFGVVSYFSGASSNLGQLIKIVVYEYSERGFMK